MEEQGGGASGDVWIASRNGKDGGTYTDFVQVDYLDGFFTSISQPKWLDSSLR